MSVIKGLKIRILPLFIFMAVLTLSIRVNDVFDSLKNREEQKITVTSNRAFAEEKSSKDTAELSRLLDSSDSAAVASSAPGNTAGNNFTQSEIAILQELAERREALDARSREIDKKAVQMKVAEDEIAKKLAQLQSYEQKLRLLMKEYTAKEQEKINALVKMYSTMKPKDAARIFNTLDLEITTALVKEMKPSTSSAIISQMEASKAKAITDALIGNSLNVAEK